MIQGYKILAIIPARGGSKGIIKKNLSLIRNKTLVEWSIDVAKGVPQIDAILVSTDDEEIAKIAKYSHADFFGKRPENLSGDCAKTVDVIRYELEVFEEKRGWKPDIVLLLQPTQPFREKEDLLRALEVFISTGGVGGLVSLSEVETHPLLVRKLVNGKCIPLLETNSTVRRQDFPKFWRVNGAVYINWATDYSDGALSLNDNKHGFISSPWTKIDIDTAEDLEYANFVAEKFLSKDK